MENEHFMFLAEALREIDAPVRPATCEYYRQQLEKLLTQQGWKRRYIRRFSNWKAHIYEKSGERIIVNRLLDHAIDETNDLVAQVFYEKTHPIPVPFYNEQKWVTLVGRVTDEGLHLWFDRGERSSLYGQ